MRASATMVAVGVVVSSVGREQLSVVLMRDGWLVMGGKRWSTSWGGGEVMKWW